MVSAIAIISSGSKDEYETISQDIRTSNFIIPGFGYNRFVRLPLSQDISTQIMYNIGHTMAFEMAGDPLSTDFVALGTAIATLQNRIHR